METAAATVGVVLTGGRSSRMGRDKALVEVDGVAMARRVADALAGAGCAPVWCQGGDARALGALGLDARPDPVPHGGPLSAVVAALRAAAPHAAVVAACDLPDLDAASVRALIEVGERHTADGTLVTVATDDDGVHLAAWWHPGAAEPLAALLAEGVASYRGAVERLGAVHVPVRSGAVRNVNHPADLGVPGIVADHGNC